METPYPAAELLGVPDRHSCPVADYRYELRRGNEVVSTGHLTREQPLEIGQQLEIGGQPGIIRTIEPLLGQPELRLVVQLLRPPPAEPRS